jgi:hypothetical protein
MANNVSTPGTVRIALVRTIEMNGSGGIATVTFDRVRSTGADIQALTASVLSGTGRPVQAATEILNSAKVPDKEDPAAPASGAPASGSPANEASGTQSPDPGTGTMGGATSPTPSGGTGVLLIPMPPMTDRKADPPADRQPGAEAAQPEAEKAAAPEPLQTAKAERPALRAPEPEKKKVTAYPSVLEKFREYKGEKTPQALTSLFAPHPAAAAQQPHLVLTDGKATLSVAVELDSKGENNNFLLEGLTLVSLKNKEKNLWIAELLPDARAWEASIVIPHNNQWNVLPLTVAPPMDVNIDRSSARLDEKDFKLFLKELGTAKAPRFDLNNDGKRDYIDDYIFTANYIAQQKGKDGPKKGK